MIMNDATLYSASSKNESTRNLRKRYQRLDSNTLRNTRPNDPIRIGVYSIEVAHRFPQFDIFRPLVTNHLLHKTIFFQQTNN